jgi:hypothetical protein
MLILRRKKRFYAVPFKRNYGKKSENQCRIYHAYVQHTAKQRQHKPNACKRKQYRQQLSFHTMAISFHISVKNPSAKICTEGFFYVTCQTQCQKAFTATRDITR